MDIITLTEQIQKKINEIDMIRMQIKERGENKSQTIGEYEREIAVTIIKLKNGIEFEVDGQKIQNPQVTILEKIARGICWDKKIEMEKADAAYKSIIVNLEAVEAQLNAFQSLNRHLD